MSNSQCLLAMSSKVSPTPKMKHTIAAVWLVNKRSVNTYTFEIGLANLVRSGVTSDLQDFTNEIAAKLQATEFPNFGGYSVIFTTGYMLSETQTTSKRSQIVENMRTHHPEFSDIAPVNLFPRNTTSTASDYRWAFDTQSAGWEVHTTESHRLIFLTMCIYSDA